MPKNISTGFDEFVNENVKKVKVSKDKVNKEVFEVLSNSDKKLNISEISKLTGHKTDNVYVALIGIKEAKSRKINDILYWYFNENQSDPIFKAIVKKDIDPAFMKLYEKDLKNPTRNIFLSADEYQAYRQKDIVVKPKRKRRK